MSVYKPKIDQTAESFADDVDNDGSLMSSDKAYILPLTSNKRCQQHAAVWKCTIFLIIFVVVIASALGAAYFFMRGTHDGYKPWIETCRVHYHQWKAGADGKEKSFLMEGEYYQQVEIDISLERYVKLNVPPILNSRRASVLHDMTKGLTAVVDQDHGRCFITQINDTIVRPISDFYSLVQYNKAGYYLPDAELIHDHYRLQKPQIEDVSQLGSRIYLECRFFDTYRLVRDNPSDQMESIACHFEGEQYCMGNAGAKYMLIFTISRCVG